MLIRQMPKGERVPDGKGALKCKCGTRWEIAELPRRAA